MFKLFDKLEFTGTGMESGIYTFIQYIDGLNDPVIQVRKGDVIRNASAKLFKFIRSGEPIYKEGEQVRVVHDNRLMLGVINLVSVSYTNKPNMYRIELQYQGGAIYSPIEVEESYIFPINIQAMDSTATTLKHINRVAELVNKMAILLIERASRHDASKLVSPEKDILDFMEYVNVKEGPAPYGSEEYARRSRLLKPFLDSHYSKNNSHHPEAHDNYLHGMTLLDVMEMICDHAAAAERGGETLVNLSHSAERFCMSDQLKHIIENTYRELGVSYK